MANKKDWLSYLWITIIGLVLFVPFLGTVPLFDWDEANFAEAAREMIATGDYLRVHIDFLPFWEKPPLFIWLQALAMLVFGDTTFAARLPNALIGIATLCSLYYMGNKVSNNKLGFWWVGLYIASWLPHFYFKTAIIDPLFNLLIFWAVFQLYLINYGTKSAIHALLSGVFLGLAVLTKGPAAVLICLLTLAVFLVISKFKAWIQWNYLLMLMIACAVTTFIWFGIDIAKNGWWFTNEFIVYQIRLFSTEDAGHGGPFYYHWVVLLIGCFPAAAFLFQYFKGQNKVLMLAPERTYQQLMWALLGVVLILFSIVKTKIVHYSSLCYLPLTFLAAQQLQWWYEGKRSLLGITKWTFWITGILILILITALPIVGQNLDQISPLVKDVFAQGNMLAKVDWAYYEVIFGLLGIAGLIFAWIKMRTDIRKGFTYLVVSQAFIIFVTMVLFVPKIERYSQGAAIDFYKVHAIDKAYVHPLGFKSYAYLFYSKREVITDTAYANNKTEYLLTAPLDKPVFFISKNIHEKDWLENPNLEKIGDRNGYVFYKRKDQ